MNVRQLKEILDVFPPDTEVQIRNHHLEDTPVTGVTSKSERVEGTERTTRMTVILCEKKL